LQRREVKGFAARHSVANCIPVRVCMYVRSASWANGESGKHST
jgi:hypothetical protein